MTDDVIKYKFMRSDRSRMQMKNDRQLEMRRRGCCCTLKYSVDQCIQAKIRLSMECDSLVLFCMVGGSALLIVI